MLVVVRPDLAPADMPDESALRVIATRYVAPGDRTQEALEMIVPPSKAAAAKINEVQLNTVEAEQAHSTPQGMALPYVS